MLDLAQLRGVWLANRLEPSVVPNVAKLELNIGEPGLEITPGEAAEPFASIVAA
jgi:hypothetical protein